MADEETTQIPGERAETSTGRRIDNNPILKRGAVALAIVAFVSFALWSMRGNNKPSETAQPERVVIRQTSDFEPAKEPVQPVVAPDKLQLPTPVLTEEKPADDDKLLDAARRAPVMAYGAEKTQSAKRQQGDARADPDANYVPLGNTPGSFGGERENEDQRFNRMLTPTRLQGSRAGTLGNRDFIVAMGTSIPCVLETALSSDQPGFTSCVINRDVLSDNGRVVLMEKGTQVVGEYRGGLRRGQKRLFVLWNRAKTPKGVIITLPSPATDALGRGRRHILCNEPVAGRRRRCAEHHQCRSAGCGDCRRTVDQHPANPDKTPGRACLNLRSAGSRFFQRLRAACDGTTQPDLRPCRSR
jgi:type IV secretion system protein VirB10